MRKEWILDLVFNLIITITISILGFVVSKVFIDNMGITNLGLMKLFSQIVAYLTLLDMGLSSAAMYYFYKPLNEGDWNRISEIFTTISSFYKKISILIVILGLVLSPLVIYISGENLKIAYIYWFIYVINSSLSYTLIKYSTLFLADQKYRTVKIIDGLGSCFEKIIQLYVIIYFKSFILFIIISTLFFCIKLYFYRRKFIENYPEVKLTFKKDLEILKTAKKVLFHKISYMIVYNTDYMIISKFISLAAVGIYSGYLTIYNLVMTIIGIFHSVLDSKLGKVISKNSNNRNLIFWEIMFRVSFLVGTVLVLIFYFSINDFIILWLGKQYIFELSTVFIISLNLFIDIVKWPVELFKYKYGYVKDIHLPILESFINLCLSIILVRKIGINGVLLGTLSSNIIIVLIFRGILVFENCFLKNKNIYLKELMINFFFTIMSCYIVNLFLKKYLRYEGLSWNSWIISLFTRSIFLMFVVFFIFLLRRKFRYSLYKLFQINKEEDIQ